MKAHQTMKVALVLRFIAKITHSKRIARKYVLWLNKAITQEIRKFNKEE